MTNAIEAGLVRRLIHPLWAARDHPQYRRYRRQCEEAQHYPLSTLRDVQEHLLRDQLLHAYTNVPFYRERFDRLKLTPFDIERLEDLQLLPVLTKRDIQENGPALLARNVPEAARVRNRTGGSVGSPLQFWVDKVRFDSRRASTDRHNAWAGIRPGDLCAQLWGAVLDTGTAKHRGVPWRQRLLHRQIALNTASVTEPELLHFAALLRRYRPKALIAYAQSAAMFAEFCLEHEIRDIHFESITATAEVLFDHQKATIEEAFAGKVFNRYGCREVSIIASDCAFHTGMHVNADTLIVEIEPQPGMPERGGRLLVTDLLNRSMPLIRYEIGDSGTWATGPDCPCGRQLPRIAKIEGRITDFLLLPDGKRISGPALTLVHADMREVRQVQYVQEHRDRVKINVVCGTGYTAATRIEMLRRLDPYVQGAITWDVEQVAQIEKEPSGKYRFVKNALLPASAESAVQGALG